jgi:SpoVK/Ycf46/Vps4 family AAA+-type ATPase
MGIFKLSSKINIKDLEIGQELKESDFSHFEDGVFYQYEFISQDNDSAIEAKPGIFRIEVENYSAKLVPTEFMDEPLLEEYIHTEEVSSKIDKFFSKIDIYKQYGVFPKRGCLLYGSQGTGKSRILTKVINNYVKDDKTFVLVWNTDKYEARHMKSLLQSITYDKSIEKMILVAEDIGGVEYNGGAKLPSQSSMLSLLDNVEKTFTIPTLILATTNFPESLLENLTNRPQRFDDVVKVGNPSPEFRAKFLGFFSKDEATEEDKEEIKNRKYNDLSVAHIKEIVIRAKLYDVSFAESMKQVLKQCSRAKKDDFSDSSRRMGIGSLDDE